MVTYRIVKRKERSVERRRLIVIAGDESHYMCVHTYVAICYAFHPRCTFFSFGSGFCFANSTEANGYEDEDMHLCDRRK